MRTALPRMERSAPLHQSTWSTPDEVQSTHDLLQLARAGDATALDRLFARYVKPLTRWAHGRLPRWARDIKDTDDLVQESVVHTLRQIDHFRPAHDGAFHAYLRRVLYSRLIDEIRRVGKMPRTDLELDHPDHRPSPVEQAISAETLAKYEAALMRLTPDEREAVVARVELGCSYIEIAEAMGKPTADAARMMVTRALLRLAEEMGHER
jgi:RNA polymerase sigma-70 factor, ECF subfamily